MFQESHHHIDVVLPIIVSISLEMLRQPAMNRSLMVTTIMYFDDNGDGECYYDDLQ